MEVAPVHAVPGNHDEEGCIRRADAPIASGQASVGLPDTTFFISIPSATRLGGWAE